MGDPCMLMITPKACLLKHKTKQAGLLSNKTMQQKHEMCPPNSETMVEGDPHPAQYINDPLDMLFAHIPSMIMQGKEYSAQPGGGAGVGSMMSTQERQRSSSPPPHFPYDQKTVAQ